MIVTIVNLEFRLEITNSLSQETKDSFCEVLLCFDITNINIAVVNPTNVSFLYNSVDFWCAIVGVCTLFITY